MPNKISQPLLAGLFIIFARSREIGETVAALVDDMCIAYLLWDIIYYLDLAYRRMQKQKVRKENYLHWGGREIFMFGGQIACGPG